MPYTRTRTFEDNINPVGGGLGPALEANVANQWEAAHQEASDRIGNILTNLPVFHLGPPSGDATGFTDTNAIRGALAIAAAAGGGVVMAQAGRVYRVASFGTTQVSANPTGGTAAYNVCLSIPSNVVLDMNGSTLRLAGSTQAIVVANATTSNPVSRDRDLGLRNVVLDMNNVNYTSHASAQFAYVTRLTLDNVKVVNGRYLGLWVYACDDSRFDRLDVDGFQGQPLQFGDPQNGNGGGGGSGGQNQVYRSAFGRIRARNVTLLNTGSQPGNPFAAVLTDCTIDSIHAYNCSAGIKIYQPGRDITIGHVLLDTCGQASALNSGLKLQGDITDGPVTRVNVGTVIALNQANNGLYLEYSKDCSVGTYIGFNNCLLHTANCDVWVGGTNDYVGSVKSDRSGGGGVRIRGYSKGYRFPDVRVTNPGQQSGALIKAGIYVEGGEGSFGNTVTVDDQSSHTMTRGFDIPSVGAAAVGFVQRFSSSGQTAEAFRTLAAGFRAPVETAYTTAGRPSPAQLTVGQMVYDTTLGKPIWYNGTNWRDAAGTVV